MNEQEEFEFRLRLEKEQGAAKPQKAAPEGEKNGGWMDVNIPGVGASPRTVLNAGAGAVRGAGSIGATLMWPIDKATDLIEGDRAPNVSGLVTGKQPLSRNEERRQDMTNALDTMGADTNSLAFGAGKLGGEIAGTAGAGGAVANLLGKLPGVATAVPGVLNALRTGGMSTGQQVGPGAINALKDIGARVVGGAVSGGASAGLVNPEDAGMGAALGGALPVVTKVAGAVGEKVGNVLRGPDQSADLAAAIQGARGSGYVIPPTQANPTLGNRLLEGFSGKITTAQNASAKNQVVTNAKAATAIGLPADTKITPDVLKNVRDQAGAAYDAIGNAGVVTPGKAYDAALDAIAAPHVKAAQGFPNAKPSPVLDLVDQLRAPNFDASSAVAKIKELRTAADDAFRSGNTDIARASKSASKALEDTLEAHLAASGNTQVLDDFRAARQLIAKTYSVEKALNSTTGAVDARKLASQLAKGKPLSGELKEAAEFGARFPKAAQTLEQMGSLPQTSPLDWAVGGGMSAATANPLAMLGVLARPAARATALSPVVQNRLVQGAPMQLGVNPALAQLGYQTAPVFTASGGR